MEPDSTHCYHVMGRVTKAQIKLQEIPFKNRMDLLPVRGIIYWYY